MRILFPLLATVISLTVTACNKKENPIDLPLGGKVVPTPIGITMGEPYYELVDREGANVKSPDGNIELLIPPGALDETTEIGIEPLKNTSHGGKGLSYRLTPHGKQFKKPVTIRFNYGKHQQLISSAQAMEIAFQNDKGEWTCVGKTQLDEVRKTISVQTDHFSDWSVIASMELTPVVATVGLGEKITLKAIRYIIPMNEDWLVPLVAPEGTGEPVKLEASYIVGWSLSGAGQLNGNGAEAVYTAPASKPANSTATVTLELNVRGKKVLLISTIYIIEDGISISIDGGPWTTYPAMAGKLPTGDTYSMNNIMTSADQPQISFLWPAINGSTSAGQYNWSMLGASDAPVVFQYFEPGQTHVYASIYKDDVEMFDSGGFLAVEESQKNGNKYISGVFAIDKAGYFERTMDGRQIKVSGIKGVFKVKRGW